MILSNIELFKALDDGRIIIKPEPAPRRPTIAEPNSPYDTHSVDLRLASQINIPQEGQFVYDVKKAGKIADTISKHSKKITLTEDTPFVLKRQQFILGQTREQVYLPISTDADTCLAARIEGKSSRARFGILVHFTAPTVHPGWEGTLTLEIANLGPVDFLLRPGMYIAQLIVEEVKGCPVEKPSEFQGQSTPAGVVKSDGHE